EVPRNRRRCPRSLAVLVAREGVSWPDLRLPQLVAILDIEREEVFLAIASAHDIEAIADDGRTGVAGARLVEGPQESRPVLGPLLEQSLFGRDIIAGGALPLRPVGSEQCRAKQSQDQGKSRGFLHPCASRLLNEPAAPARAALAGAAGSL